MGESRSNHPWGVNVKSFVFTWSEGKPPRDGSGVKKTVRVWRIVRNQPILIGTDTQSFVSKDQHVLMCLEKNKALPKKAFERGPSGGYAHMLWSLKEKGIARITEIY